MTEVHQNAERAAVARDDVISSALGVRRIGSFNVIPVIALPIQQVTERYKEAAPLRGARAAVRIVALPIFQAAAGPIVRIALLEPSIGIVAIVAGVIEQCGEREMNAAALRILSGGIAVGALPIVQNAESVPVASSLAEQIGVVIVIALPVAQHADTAIGADPRAPRAHAEAESMRHGAMRAIGPTAIRIFPSGAVRIVAGIFEQHAETFHVGKSLRIRIGAVLIRARLLI